MNNIQKYFAGREQFIELLEAVGIRTLNNSLPRTPPPFCLNFTRQNGC